MLLFSCDSNLICQWKMENGKWKISSSAVCLLPTAYGHGPRLTQYTALVFTSSFEFTIYDLLLCLCDTDNSAEQAGRLVKSAAACGEWQVGQTQTISSRSNLCKPQ